MKASPISSLIIYLMTMTFVSAEDHPPPSYAGSIYSQESYIPTSLPAGYADYGHVGQPPASPAKERRGVMNNVGRTIGYAGMEVCKMPLKLFVGIYQLSKSALKRLWDLLYQSGSRLKKMGILSKTWQFGKDVIQSTYDLIAQILGGIFNGLKSGVRLSLEVIMDILLAIARHLPGKAGFDYGELERRVEYRKGRAKLGSIIKTAFFLLWDIGRVASYLVFGVGWATLSFTFDCFKMAFSIPRWIASCISDFTKGNVEGMGNSVHGRTLDGQQKPQK